MTSILTRNCLIFIGLVLAIMSIATLSLKITSYNFISEYSDKAFDFDPQSNGNGKLIFFLPHHLYISALNLAVASSIVSLLTALAVVIFTLCSWADKKRNCILPPHYVYIAVLFNAFFSLITLIYNLATHARSAYFNSNSKDPISPGSAYYDGTFDLETWTCDIARSPAHTDIYTPQCRIERAGRGMLITGFIFSLFALGMAVWAFKSEKKRWQEAIAMKKLKNRRFDED